MSQEIPFDPLPFISNPHRQTIIGSFFNFLSEPHSVQKIIRLPDGDRISMEITTPSEWKNTDLTVVFVHGLCGSHKSPNLVRMARRLEPLGIRTVRFNMRNCGSGRGLSRKIYHSGKSEDILEGIKDLKKAHPDSPIVLIGYSLGGALVLKLTGELNVLAQPFIERVIAVSPPVDLYSSIRMLGEPENAMYEKYFYRTLRADVHYVHGKYKDLPKVNLPRSLKIYEFDQVYTAPMSGFSNVFEFYDKCSASNVVTDIAIPCKILLAEDDPIISPHSLDCFNMPSNINIYKTKKGGHMGYLGRVKGERGFYWLDSLLVDWITEKL